MRRPTPHAVDDLNALLKAMLELRRGEGSHLPGHAESIVLCLGLQPEGVARMRELRERLGLGQSRTSRLCAALARAGWVEVVTPAEDRRASAVRLTAKGRRLIDRTLTVLRGGPRRRA